MMRPPLASPLAGQVHSPSITHLPDPRVVHGKRASARDAVTIAYAGRAWIFPLHDVRRLPLVMEAVRVSLLDVGVAARAGDGRKREQMLRRVDATVERLGRWFR